MALIICTDDKGVVIYRKDKVSKAGNPYSTYTIKVSSKDASGEWQSFFQEVGFKKGVSVNNKAVIKINATYDEEAKCITGGNASFKPNNFGDVQKSKIMIWDFEIIDEGEAPSSESGDGFMDIPDGADEELPFA